MVVLTEREDHGLKFQLKTGQFSRELEKLMRIDLIGLLKNDLSVLKFLK
jgi:hypothetical protein